MRRRGCLAALLGASLLTGPLAGPLAVPALAAGPAPEAGAAGAALPAPPEPLPCNPAGPLDPSFAVTSRPVAGDPRLVDLTIDSGAVDSYMQATARRLPHAYVLLPPGYDPTGGSRYPVLYLLHGHGGSYTDWVRQGDVEQIEAAAGYRNVIVVMPDGGYDGFYSNWYGIDPDGHNGAVAPAWETFHIDELVPWIDSHYNTIADRSGRFIAGLSMGGGGAIAYAARHPDLFSVAGAFSGAVYPDLDWPVGSLAQEQVANLPDGRPADQCVWGDPVTEDVVWRNHDPTELAANLATVDLYVASGTGAPDPSPGAPAYNPEAAATEQGIFQDSVSFVASLRRHDHPAATLHTNFYPAGTHDWFYWRKDLAQFLAILPKPPIHSGNAPASWSFQTADASFSVWGWQFDLADRPVAQFLYLDGVHLGRGKAVAGFEVAGSGELHVTTPPGSVQPHRTYRVVVTDLTTSSRTPSTVTAAADGSLPLTVPLGPPPPTQEYVFGAAGRASVSAGHTFRVEVTAP